MPQRVRTYEAERDHPAVVEMCADVYGGTDMLPQILNDHVHSGTRVWVAQSASGAAEAILCCQPRRDVAWVYGARTAPPARGRGLGALLLRHVEQQAAQAVPDARWLMAATIAANHAMLRLFERQGWPTLCELDIWPRREVVNAAADRLLEEAEEQQQQQQEEPLLLGTLPPAISAQLQAAGEALRPRWQPCTSTSQLVQLNALLRQRRAAAVGSPAGCGLLCWAPGFFNVVPLEGSTMEGMVQAGNVWVLPPPPGSSPGEAGAGAASEVDAALLVLSSWTRLDASKHQHKAWLAGIVAGSPAALASAILHALALRPRCLEFFIDRCELFEAPAFVRGAAGQREAMDSVGPGPSCFMVRCKALG